MSVRKLDHNHAADWIEPFMQGRGPDAVRRIIADHARISALSAPAPQGIGREALINLIDGEPAFMSNVMDENRIWLATILTDRILALLPTEPPARRREINMQDVRLMAGEGKLTNADILNAVNAILRKQPLPEPPAQGEG